MNTTVAPAPDEALHLSGSLCIYDVERVCEAILAHLAGHSSLVLDIGKVSQCDAAGLQVLVAAARSADRAGKSFQICAASPAIRAHAASLGVAASTLSLPQPE